MQKKRWSTAGAIIIHERALTAEERKRARDPKERCSFFSLSNSTNGLTNRQFEEMAASVGVARSQLSDKNKVRERVQLAFDQGVLIALRQLPVGSTSGSKGSGSTGATRGNDGELQLHGSAPTSTTQPTLWYGPFPVAITGKENDEEFVLLTWMQVFALEREQAQKILTNVKARVVGTFKLTAKELSAKRKQVSISAHLYEEMLALRSGKDVATLRKEAAEREQRFNKRFKTEQETIRKKVDGEFKRRTDRPYPGANASPEDQQLRRLIQDELLQNEEAGEADPAGLEMPVKIGFIAHKDGANIRTIPAELPGSKCLTTAPLPPGTRVVVIGTHPQSPEWSFATTVVGDRIVRGYVQGFRITTDLPEPAAVLYRIKPKDMLEPMAARIYHQTIQPGRDLRFYENVILYVNQQKGRVGVRRVNGDVQLVAGHCIWLVSVAFANQLQEIVPSGSITGGAFARARMVAQHFEDIISSVKVSPKYFPGVAGEYWDTIRKHLPEIVGCVILFIAAEAASTLLAAVPAGVTQLAAALIQLVLAILGAKGVVEAATAAVKHANDWLTLAWKANGDVTKIGEASKAFCRMVFDIILVVLGMLGMRSNLGRGMKLAEGVRFTRPGLATMQLAGGGTVVVFNSGIHATAAASVPVNPMTGLASGLTQNAKSKSADEPITNKPLDDAEVEKLLEKLPNWERIKQFVGRRIPKPDTPEFAALKQELEAAGYQLHVMKEGAQPFRLHRLGGKAQGDELAALTVTNEGRIVIQIGKTSRISVYSRCRKNYLDWVEAWAEKTLGKDGKAARAAAEARIARGNQLHHLTPDEIVQSHPLTREALERVEGYTVDRGSNVLDMPSAANEAGEIMHLGSHPKYSKLVTSKLDQALQEVSRGGKLALPNISSEAINKVLSRVETELRKAIETGNLPKEVLKELLEDGIPVGKKLALLEIRREGEVLFA
jgi:uncharacterized protein YceH (UPF0502 family)